MVFPIAIDSIARRAQHERARRVERGMFIAPKKESAKEALPADGDHCCPLRVESSARSHKRAANAQGTAIAKDAKGGFETVGAWANGFEPHDASAAHLSHRVDMDKAVKAAAKRKSPGPSWWLGRGSLRAAVS
jgi:hypothetical protein